MKILISNSSSVPIYEQIKNAMISGIMNGELEEEESLPSIRSLAQDLRISIMTVKKAYDELEHEGYIMTRQGKGSFVAKKNMELKKEQARKQIENHLEEIITLAYKFNISLNEVIDLIKYLMEGEEK